MESLRATSLGAGALPASRQQQGQWVNLAVLLRLSAAVACRDVDCTWHFFPADSARCARDAVSQGHNKDELASAKVFHSALLRDLSSFAAA